MLPHLKILNSREKKRLFKELSLQFGDIDKLDYVFMQNNKDKIFVITRDIENINLEKLRINNGGLYFAKKENAGIRPSIEGAQLIKATKNIIEVSSEQTDKWMRGEDFEIKGDYKGYVIIKSKSEIFGCGQYKDGIVRNMVAKERRIKQGAREPEFN